jgi:O-antigen chain-terminating methyltransferase
MDAIEYLKSLKENSISTITGFHIVEHLPFKSLIELFDESYRVLKRGGAIIFETPNPENLRVGAYSFYIDPTHKNPIPPDTLKFIAQNRGFKDVKIHRLHPLKKPELTDNQDINDLLIDTTKAQDYAVIGYK